MDLEICKNIIIERGFKELKEINIHASYEKMKDCYMQANKLDSGGYIIKVTPSIKNAGENAILGCMSHEMAHILKWKNMGKLLENLDYILYSYISFYETYDERETDLLAVKRGFGLELMSFKKYASKRRNYTYREGLTIRELEEINKTREIFTYSLV